MKTSGWTVAATAVVVFSCGALANAPAPARADIAPPKKQNNRVVVPVTIKHGAIRGEDHTVQAKILIPKYWVQTGASLFRGPGDVPASAAPNAAPGPAEKVAPQPKEKVQAAPAAGTVVAGVALSLAAVSLGFVVRGNRGMKVAGAAILGVALVMGGYGVAQADLAPPRKQPPQDQIVIELVDEGDLVTLLLAR